MKSLTTHAELRWGQRFSPSHGDPLLSFARAYPVTVLAVLAAKVAVEGDAAPPRAGSEYRYDGVSRAVWVVGRCPDSGLLRAVTVWPGVVRAVRGARAG